MLIEIRTIPGMAGALTVDEVRAGQTTPPTVPTDSVIQLPLQSGQRISPEKSWSLVKRMRECVHWQKATDCGCGLNRCGLGLGKNGVVSHADCFQCPHLPVEEMSVL